MKTIEDKVKEGGAVKNKKPFYTDYSGHFLCVVAAEFADICKTNFPCPQDAGYNPEFVEAYHKLCSAFRDIVKYAKKNLNDNMPLSSQEMEMLHMLREIRVRYKLNVYGDKDAKGNC